MRGIFLSFLVLGFVGCKSVGPDEAAIHVVASYDFKAGCIVVEAHDKDAPEKSQTKQIPVLDRSPPAKVDVAVFRAADWGSTVAITVTAHERTCDGAEVARETRESSLKKAGIEEVSLLLSAPDEDGDTYVSTSHGGTDCDDQDANSNPGFTTDECDGHDNDCRNGVDDGHPVVDFFLDEDDDGVGAGPAVKACMAPLHHVALSGDCDDHNASRAPGKTESCDDVDNDCNDKVDDGLSTVSYYRDADGDGYGVEADKRESCNKPTGYVSNTSFDCNDGNADVHPGATELCNGEDENCAGGADETFTQKGQACTNSGCSGTYICDTDPKKPVVCNAPQPVSYYVDSDGDGQGTSLSPVENACPPTVPSGKVTNNTDCDDTDPLTQVGAQEICDDRDNNCVNGKTDEAAVCNGKGWKAVTMPNGRDWYTVALGTGGSPVWVAGASGALAWRANSATGSFTEFHQKCGNITWFAAWVRPSDGAVFLAGDGGYMATYTANAADCATTNTGSAMGGPSSSPLRGIVGIESGTGTTVYAVNGQGSLYSWTPGNLPVFRSYRSVPLPYWDIHTANPSTLLIAAEALADTPQVDSFDLVESARTVHAMDDVPAANKYGLHGIWAWDSTHAVAVGRKGNIVWWNGATAWKFLSPDPAMQVDLNAVSALDRSSAYIASQDGRIRRPTPTGWVEHYYSGGTALRDIAASSRQNIWAVGNSIVLHFAE
ncbi:putative metal-binding motif-containing protein [Hyalangium versicolor]|uniref:putative metal-binding motif-containing protein n=1 Tax=Hyalangium versicolor TaxID=2861190 RepID=UPI001CCAB0E1|nr:putative metal-binding motif-containing protein [Hyalangium versicolor]